MGKRQRCLKDHKATNKLRKRDEMRSLFDYDEDSSAQSHRRLRVLFEDEGKCEETKKSPDKRCIGWCAELIEKYVRGVDSLVAVGQLVENSQGSYPSTTIATAVTYLRLAFTTDSLSGEQKASLSLPIACFCLATKVHDREVVRASDLASLDSSLCGAEILATERDLAFALDWACRRITAIDIVDEILSTASKAVRECWRARLYWETLFVGSYAISAHRPSQLVAAAIARVVACSEAPLSLSWLPKTLRRRVEAPDADLAKLQRELARLADWVQARKTTSSGSRCESAQGSVEARPGLGPELAVDNLNASGSPLLDMWEQLQTGSAARGGHGVEEASGPRLSTVDSEPPADSERQAGAPSQASLSLG